MGPKFQERSSSLSDGLLFLGSCRQAGTTERWCGARDRTRPGLRSGQCNQRVPPARRAGRLYMPQISPIAVVFPVGRAGVVNTERQRAIHRAKAGKGAVHVGGGRRLDTWRQADWWCCRYSAVRGAAAASCPRSTV